MSEHWKALLRVASETPAEPPKPAEYLMGCKRPAREKASVKIFNILLSLGYVGTLKTSQLPKLSIFYTPIKRGLFLLQ